MTSVWKHIPVPKFNYWQDRKREAAKTDNWRAFVAVISIMIEASPLLRLFLAWLLLHFCDTEEYFRLGCNNGAIPETDHMIPVNRKLGSAAKCGRICARNEECGGFRFTPGGGDCFLSTAEKCKDESAGNVLFQVSEYLYFQSQQHFWKYHNSWVNSTLQIAFLFQPYEHPTGKWLDSTFSEKKNPPQLTFSKRQKSYKTKHFGQLCQCIHELLKLWVCEVKNAWCVAKTAMFS